MAKNKVRRGFSATQILVIGFFVVISLGALLLHLPAAASSGEATPFLDCLFTAVSATCVTGLAVVDTALHWSLFGQAVILLMIQIGGLGFMTCAVLISMLLRRRISPREKILLASSYNLVSFEGMMTLVRRVLLGTLCFEMCGAAVLSIRFIPLFGVADGIWKGVFHSVSAFCNAGFDLMGTYSGAFSSLTAFAVDPVVCITAALLIMLGGIGFVVWDDIYEWFRARNRINPYTKIVITVSGILWVGGTLLYAVEEWNNPATLGSFSSSEKILAAFFQSVTMRTAGFSTISQADMSTVSQAFSLILMFIGGASGSTAGGVKVVTFALLICSVWMLARGQRHITLCRRTVPSEDVVRAFTLCVIQFIITMAAVLILLKSGVPIMDALFESFSASGTVGISLGITPHLAPLARIVIMTLMYFGRVGILTIAMTAYSKSISDRNQMQYANIRLMIG